MTETESFLISQSNRAVKYGDQSGKNEINQFSKID